MTLHITRAIDIETDEICDILDETPTLLDRDELYDRMVPVNSVPYREMDDAEFLRSYAEEVSQIKKDLCSAQRASALMGIINGNKKRR